MFKTRLSNPKMGRKKEPTAALYMPQVPPPRHRGPFQFCQTSWATQDIPRPPASNPLRRTLHMEVDGPGPVLSRKPWNVIGVMPSTSARLRPSSSRLPKRAPSELRILTSDAAGRPSAHGTWKTGWSARARNGWRLKPRARSGVMMVINS